MTSKEYIKELDWSAAIAKATQKLEKGKKYREAYLNRGIARLFSGGKDGKYKEAIEDLSNAIAQGRNNNQVYYYRAYAFFLDGNYEKAIQDCHKITGKCLTRPGDCKPEQCPCSGENKVCPHSLELLGKIYMAISDYPKAVCAFSTAMKHYAPRCFPPGLMDLYRESCRKMNSLG